MSAGEALLGLFGQKDPRQAMLESILQANNASAPAGAAAGGAPYAAAGTTGAGPAHGGAAGATPDAPPQPQAYQTPPDLSAMYGQLMKYDDKSSNINRGLGLIGSSISQEGDRANTLAAFQGDTPKDPTFTAAGIIDQAQNLNKLRLSAQVRAAQLAALPDIAARYGIDLNTARYLMENGKLDELVNNAEKPNMTTMKDASGQLVTVDMNKGKQRGGALGPLDTRTTPDALGRIVTTDTTGNQVGPSVGPTKVRPTHSATLANGQPITVYDDTGEQVGAPIGAPKPVLIDGADGSKSALVNPSDPSKGLIPLIPKDASTNDTKNYHAYVVDEDSRGNTTPLSFDDWKLSHERNASNRAENAFQSKLGGYEGDMYQKTQDGADAAQSNIQNYDTIKMALNTGLNTGTFGESDLTMRKFAKSIGIDNEDADKIAGGELSKMITNKLTLAMRNPSGGEGMPGNMSDADRDFLKQSNVSLSNTKAGNNLALNVFRATEQRKIDLARMQDDFLDNNPDHNLKGWNRYKRDYIQAHPLFSGKKITADGDIADAVPTAKTPAGGLDADTQALVDKYRKK